MAWEQVVGAQHAKARAKEIGARGVSAGNMRAVGRTNESYAGARRTPIIMMSCTTRRPTLM